MAEILIKLEHANNPSDPNAWTKWHPVVVKPDGWEWGLKERPPWNLVLRITDMTVEEVLPYIERDDDLTDPKNPVSRAVRKWKVDLDDITIPQNVRNVIDQAITSRQILTVTKAQVVNFIKRTL